MKTHKPTKQENILDELFSRKASLPNVIFQKSLRKGVLHRYKNQDNLFLTIFYMFTRKQIVTVSIVGIIVIVTAVSLGGYTLFRLMQSKNETTQTRQLSKEDGKSILARVLNNTPGTALNAKSIESSNRSAQAESIAADSSGYNLGYGPLVERDYSYSKTVTSIDKGPAAEECKAYSVEENSRNEYYEYFDESNYYSKNVSYNQDGELVDYFLADNNSYLEYKGGAYAIKYIYSDAIFMPLSVEDKAAETPSSEEDGVSVDSSTGAGAADSGVTNDSPVSSSDPYDLYFGTDAVVEEVVENGVVVKYIVTWEFQTSCDIVYFDSYSGREKGLTSDTNSNTVTIISRGEFDADSFQPRLMRTYRSSISDENLLMTNTTELETTNQLFPEVSSIFTFEFPVEVREIRQEDLPTDYNQLVEDYVNEENFNFVTPRLEYQYQYAYVTNKDPYTATYAYQFDRTFYPQGALGDELYQRALEYSPLQSDTVLTELSATFVFPGTANEGVIYIDMYNTLDVNEVLNNLYTENGNYTDEEYENVTISINEESVNARYYESTATCYSGVVEPSNGQIPEGGEICNDPNGPSYIQYLMVFVYEGKVYAVTTSGENINGLSILSLFFAYDTSNSAERTELLEIIRNPYIPTDGGSVDGSSGSGGSSVK